MDLKQIVILALQVSLLGTVFGFGLNTTASDLLYLLRRPRLLARSLLAIFVIMPLLVVILVRSFDFSTPLKVVLLALAISPVPPLLPRKESRAGGRTAYGLALMTLLAVLSIAVVPLWLNLLAHIFDRPLGVSTRAIALIVIRVIVIPLAAGVAFRVMFPAIAGRIERIVTQAVTALLMLAVLVLLAAAASAIWAVVEPVTLLALVIFAVAGGAIGHILGGPDREHATVLALSTATRHPAIALTIAVANFPEPQDGPLILLYILISAVVLMPYLAWQRRHRVGAAALGGA